jgi:hypothetical protein
MFAPAIKRVIGGMETRAALIGRKLLARKKWNPFFVVNDFGQAQRTCLESMDFEIYQYQWRIALKNYRKLISRRSNDLDANPLDSFLSLAWQVPLLFFFNLLPGWAYSIFWRRIQAEIVCCFGNNRISAEVIADCRRTNKKTLLCIASDDDLSDCYYSGSESKNKYRMPCWMGHFAIENADYISVQTEAQQQLLLNRFGREGTVIRNPVKIKKNDLISWPLRDKREFILWIGRSENFHKRPRLFLELARRCPDLQFFMVMNKSDADVFDDVICGRSSNIEIIEQVPHSEIWGYYRRARLFVSTAACEGFPNTFLQCAVAGVPVASLEVDPDGILSKKGCGMFAEGSLERLEKQVRALWSDAELAENFAMTFHRYALEHHNMESQVAQFESLLDRVLEQPVPIPRLPWWRKPHKRFVRWVEA